MCLGYAAHLQPKPQATPGQPRAVAVLHTHSRTLSFHPHVHVVMPAAALDADKGLWRTLRNCAKDGGGGGYLFNHQALAKVFRGKFLLPWLPWLKRV